MNENETSSAHADIVVPFNHGRRDTGELPAYVWQRGAGEDGLPAIVARGVAYMRGTNEPSTVKIAGWAPDGYTWDLTSPNTLKGEWSITARPTRSAEA